MNKRLLYLTILILSILVLGCGSSDCSNSDLPETVAYDSNGASIINDELKTLEGVFIKIAPHRDDYSLTLRFDEDGTRFELHFDDIFLNNSIQILSLRDTVGINHPDMNSHVSIFGCDRSVYELDANDSFQDFLHFTNIDTISNRFEGEFELSLKLRPSIINSGSNYGDDLILKNGQFDLVLFN